MTSFNPLTDPKLFPATPMYSKGDKTLFLVFATCMILTCTMVAFYIYKKEIAPRISETNELPEA